MAGHVGAGLGRQEQQGPVELGLLAPDAAATERTDRAAARRALEANPTFVREKSRLVVIFLSDEEDCSDPDRDLTLALDRDRCLEEAAR